MAVGRPLLAVWKPDNTLYLYEFVPETGFALIASGSLTSGGGAPFFAFMKNSKRLFQAARISAGTTQVSTVTLSLARIPSSSGNTKNIDNTSLGLFISSPDGDFLLAVSGAVSQPNALALLNDDSITLLTSNLAYTGDKVRSVAMQKSKNFVIFGGTVGNSWILPRVRNDANGYPVFNSTVTAMIDAANNGKVRKVITGITGAIVACAWANFAEKFAFLGNDAGDVYVGQLTDSAGDFTFHIAFSVKLETGFVARSIKSRMDDKYVAISSYSATAQVYRTYIYQRLGYILQPFQTITNFGRQLDWSEDGSIIIDATSKRLFKFDTGENTFIEQSTLMNAVVSGATVQALSRHVIDNSPSGYVYDGVVNALVSKSATIDKANLKLMLLNSAITFDPTEDSTLDMAIGEVFGGGWPQGGKLLTNVVYGTNPEGNTALMADPVEQIITTPLTFRHAVIYDATTSKPLIWYQMKREIKTEKDITLKFDLASYGVVQFAS